MAEKVVVQLVLDTSRYTSNASKAAKSTGQIQQSVDKTSKSMGSFKSTALKAGAALGAAFAAKAVLDFAKSSIAAFSNLEESVNAVNVVYGEGGAAIAALGENSAESFGLSTRAVNEAAVAMGAFAEKIDAADPPGAFQNVLQRATDFASVMNLEVDEALRIFQSGLAGESEPLRKFGVDVSAATIQATALAEGIWDGNGAMSEGEKVQARYATIMEQTAKTAGDFANTSGSLANRQKTLGAQWEEMQATIGKELAPAMTKLLGLATKLIPIMKPLGVAIGDVADQIAAAAGFAETLVGWLDKISTTDAAGNTRALGSEVADLGTRTTTLTGAWDLFDEKLWKLPWAPTEAGIEDVAEATSGMTDALSTTIDRAREHATSMGNIADAADTAAESTDDLGVASGAAALTVGDLAAALDAYASGLNNVSTSFFSLRDAIPGLDPSVAVPRLRGENLPGFGPGRQARQHGGPVTAGQPFLVGEAGPELFVPDSAGRIVANNKLGGGGVTVNVNQPTTLDLASDISAGLIAGQVTQLVEGLRV